MRAGAEMRDMTLIYVYICHRMTPLNVVLYGLDLNFKVTTLKGNISETSGKSQSKIKYVM